MLSVNIVDFRKNLSDYLRLAEYKGKVIEIVDSKKGRVVAKLIPPRTKYKEGSIFDVAGKWEGTELDDDKLWNEVLTRKSRKTSIKI